MYNDIHGVGKCHVQRTWSVYTATMHGKGIGLFTWTVIFLFVDLCGGL